MDIKEKRAEDIAEEVTENLDDATYEAKEAEDVRKGIEETIVKVDNITVRFNIASERIDNMKEYFIKFIRRELMFKEFFALKDVSLEIKKGESWGFIGVNGSGKSTLLKLICGILKPYKGKVTVSGSIAPLIELGAGFDYDLTARENIYLNGAVLGYDEKFMKDHFDEIVEFAELQNFLDMPIKNYSSGMAARLGFAIATMVKSDILICDEVLAVGDYAFQQKCEKRMRELLDGGTTLLYVSHATDSVKRLCDHALWLDKGRVVMKGGAIGVCDAYIKDQIGEIKAKVEGENVDYIIIQAGGKGTRLEHLTRNKPKGIVPVNNLPIVFHMFKKYPDKKYIIIGDYKNEVLEKYIETFGGCYCINVKAEGEGTAAGIKKALEHIPAGKRFMLVWSDLILGDEVNIDETKGNIIGISRDFDCRWSYKDKQFFEEPSREHGVAGLFIFSDKDILAQAPEKGEFVRWLKEQNMQFDELSLLDTVEAGTLNAIKAISEHDGEYRCRPFNSIEVHDNILIKRPIDDQGKALAVNEVKWYSEVKKYNFDQIPVIYELDPLTMEKIDGENIYKANLDTEQKKQVIDNLISSLEKLHSFAKTEADSYSIMDTYFFKTFGRLDKIRNLVPFALEKTININGKDYKNPFFYREKIKADVRSMCLDTCKEFALIHGDCTFSNTMVDDKLNVIFLDPRGYFGSTELYGDVDYDWAKLYYSIDGDYDQFNNKNFELYIEESGVRLDIATNGWKEVAPYYLSKLENVDPKKIKFLHALIWLSLTTYAWEDYDSICGAFYKGVILMDECLSDN